MFGKSPKAGLPVVACLVFLLVLNVLLPDGQAVPLAQSTVTPTESIFLPFVARMPTPTPILPRKSGIVLYVDGALAEVIYESRLRSPEGITIGPDGALYIADWLAYRVMRLTEEGELSIAAHIPLSFSSGPRDVAFDASGTMFVSMPSDIYRVTSNGELKPLAHGPCCMSKIEFGPDGHLYFANQITNKVLRVDPNGTTADVIAGLQQPFDVAFNSAGNLFVSEIDGDILRLNSDGAVSVFARTNSGLDPKHIAFDSADNLYVHGNGTLFKFDSLGNPVDFSIDGDDPSYMLGFPKANPGGIAFDASGYLYVADSPNAKISRINPSNHLEIMVRGFNPNGIALGADGNIYAGSSADFPHGPGELWRITPNGDLTVVARFDDAPYTIAADAFGNVYVSLVSRSGSRVVRVSRDSRVEELLALTQVHTYGSLAVSPSGELYISLPQEGEIYRAEMDGSLSLFAQGLSVAQGGWFFTLAFSLNGTLYAADSQSGDVLRFSYQGVPSVVTNIADLVGPPNAITVAPDLSVFVQTGNVPLNVYKVLPGGGKYKVASGVWGDPIGMVFDAQGNLYISRGGTIDRISGLLAP